MSKCATLFALLLSLLQGPAPGSGEPAPQRARHAVVVHVDNDFAGSGDDAIAIVKKLFLKELTRWPDGSEAKAYARPANSDPQVRFREKVLGMTEADLARHWLKMKSMNGATPPKEVASDRLVLKFVAKHPTAFGIVTLEAARGADGVRVLFEY